MATFELITQWEIEAPLPLVCQAISDCHRWPQWWTAVERVEEFEPGDANGIGSVKRFTWRGHLPYRLTFDIRITQAVPLTMVEGRASGEVEGVGRWRFSSRGQTTVVRYEWHIRTNRRWMNLIAPIARPVFKWNHDQVMRQGAEGMARFLGARLLKTSGDFYPRRRSKQPWPYR